MDKLTNARLTINEIDKQIAKLYEERLDAVCNVISHKIEHNLPVFDASREVEVIQKNSKLIKNQEYLTYYKEFLQMMMDNSKKYQKKIANLDIVGYQGIEGAFAYIATKKLFPECKMISFETFEDVMKALENGDIPMAVVPFENSFAGEVSDVIDLLLDYNCFIGKTYDLKISQNLIGHKNAEISDISNVFSHPQALKQSKTFLDTLDAKITPSPNTAIATKFVSDSNDKSYASVGSKETAEIYNLKILKENINTSDKNTTRFVVLYPKLSNEGNTFSAVFRTKHDAGALAKVMSIIGSKGLNVCSIKSKPVPNIPWEYYICVEIEASLDCENTQNLICEVKNHCEYFKIIGSYFKD